MPARLTKQEVLAQIAVTSPDITVLFMGEYQNQYVPIQVRCNQCGREWRTCARKLLHGRGCYHCKHSRAAKKFRLAKEQFLTRIIAISPEIEIIDDYTTRNTPILVRCRKCEYEWKATPQNLLAGTGCPPCNLTRRNHNFRLTDEEVRSRIDPDIILLSEYQTSHTKVHVRCRKCHHEWYPKPMSLLNGSGCRKCFFIRRGKEVRLSHEQVIARLHKVKLDALSRYQTIKHPMDVRCRQCGYTWTANNASLLLYGSGCPNCAEYGFQPDKPAIVYYVRIVAQNGQFVYKIGITNRTVEQRFGRDYERLVIIERWPFQKGADAYAFEQEILRNHQTHRYHGPKLFISTNTLNTEIFTCDVLGLDTERENHAA